MALARTFAVALNGVRGDLVEVEADIAAGLPAFVLIGLPDTALGESRKRVAAAAVNAGCPLTQTKLTVNLSPAALRNRARHSTWRSRSPRCRPQGRSRRPRRPASSTSGNSGSTAGFGRYRASCRPCWLRGTRASTRVLVPAGNADEARLVDGIEVIAVTGLRAAAISTAPTSSRRR